MNSFTDEYLAQLKEALREDGFGYESVVGHDSLVALLIRLDSAELVVSQFSELIRNGVIPDYVSIGPLSLWRKAAEK